MGLFGDKKVIPSFTSRASAFEYAFAEAVERGVDMRDAAKKANEFADIVAANMGLPPTPPKPKNAIDTAVGYVQQIAVLKQTNPEVWEFVTGAIGGVISSVALFSSPSQQTQPEVSPAKIDFDKIE